jgi:hypothetical protein
MIVYYYVCEQKKWGTGSIELSVPKPAGNYGGIFFMKKSQNHHKKI